MLKKYSFIYILALALMVVLSACATGESNQSEAPKGETRTITHELGETDVTIKPERVVVLEQGFTEVVAELGVKPVGVADDDRPERIAKATFDKIEGYESVGSRSEPNLEAIRILKPDLIIADKDRHQNIYDELTAIAPTIVLSNDAVTYEENLEATATIGEAIGKQTEVEQLLADHKAKVDEFKQAISKEESVLLTSNGEDGSLVFEVQSKSFFLPSFLVGAGVPYAMDEAEETSYTITLEQLLKLNPDKLIVTVNEDESSLVEELKDNELWNKLAAVENDKVFEVSHADWSRRRSVVAVNDILPKATEIFTEATTTK